LVDHFDRQQKWRESETGLYRQGQSPAKILWHLDFLARKRKTAPLYTNTSRLGFRMTFKPSLSPRPRLFLTAVFFAWYAAAQFAWAGGHASIDGNDDFQQVVITEYGGPDVLELVTGELPKPGPGEVRVRTLTTSASFTDIMLRKGIYPGLDVEPPFAPGYDMVGVIDKLGEGVTGFEVGQKVADMTILGAYATHIVRPAELLTPIPDNLDDGEVVTLMLSYMTAYQMLERAADLEAGQSILIHGASGAVGSAMSQLAVLKGLKVFGTASTAKQDFVASMGVTPIDYKTEDFVARIAEETGGEGVDVVFDAISVENFKRSYSALKPGGTLIIYGFYDAAVAADGGSMTGVAFEFLKWQWQQLMWRLFDNEDRVVAPMYGITTMRDEHPEWFREDLQQLTALLAEGRISPRVWKTMSLDQAAEAHRMIEAGEVQGKIVFRVSGK